MKTKINEYVKTGTEGNSQVDLIVKVYNGAIRNLTQARELINSGNIAKSYQALEDSKKFIVHLYTTLDMEKGGEIAKNLSGLYGFIVNEINLVQASRDVKQLDEIITILANVKEGWVELSQRGKTIKKESKKVVTADENKSLSISA